MIAGSAASANAEGAAGIAHRTGIRNRRPAVGHTLLARAETDPARALALLSRCSGTVFSAGREPLLPDYNHPIPTVLLFVVRRHVEGEPDE